MCHKKYLQKEWVEMVMTCANLPRAKADISLNCTSGDWSISIKGGTAPLWTM